MGRDKHGLSRTSEEASLSRVCIGGNPGSPNFTAATLRAALPHQIIFLVAHLRGVSPHAVDREQQVQEGEGGMQPEEVIPVGSTGHGSLHQQGLPQLCPSVFAASCLLLLPLDPSPPQNCPDSP